MAKTLTPTNKGVFDAAGKLITPEDFAGDIAGDMPFFKVAVGGYAGCGKSYTSAEIMAGIHKTLVSKKMIDPSTPLLIINTEDAAKFLKKFFEKRGVPVRVKNTRSLADVRTAFALAEQNHFFGVYIDSMTHVYADFKEKWQAKNNKSLLTPRDYGVLNPLWEREFSREMVSAKTNIVFTGRGTAAYSNVENEENGKLEMTQTGDKMQISKDSPFDPNLVIWMTQMQVKGKGGHPVVWYEGFVMKDRSDTINGKTFGTKKSVGPKWKDFEPHFTSMLDDYTPGAKSVGETSPASAIMPDPVERDNSSERKAIVLDELKGELTAAAPSRSDADNKLKLDILERAYGVRSFKVVETYGLTELSAGLEKVKKDVSSIRKAREIALNPTAPASEAPEEAPAPNDESLFAQEEGVAA